MNANNTWSDMTPDELEEAVRYHNARYWMDDAPEISDPDYDQLIEALRRARPDSDVLNAIGPAGVDPDAALGPGEKLAHEPAMLSLDKCYDEETLTKWFDKFEGKAVASPKVDGVALCIRYDAQGNLSVGATRGTGAVGEVITQNVLHVQGVPHTITQGPLEVRGEAYMPWSTFRAKFEDDYMSPRNLTAGGLKRKDGEDTKDYGICFFAYDVLGTELQSETDKQAFLTAQGFVPVPSMFVEHGDLQSTFDAFVGDRASLDYDTDGVVYKANDVAEQERMGANSHHPRYAIAYKYQGESSKSILREIEWNISRTGSINPVGIVDPVELSGAIVTRVSLHNLAIMEQRDLTIGACVLMMRRGGVIPNLESVLEAGDAPIVIPTHCPDCGEPTERRGDFLFADHNESCTSMRVRQLEHFVKAFEMKGFGSKVIASLYDAGLVVEYEDLFRLDKTALLKLDRMADKSAQRLIDNAAARQTVSADVFMRAFGIHELGRHVSKILAQRCATMDEVFEITAEEMAEIHTIGELIAKHVTEGLSAQRETMERVLAVVTVEFPAPVDEDAAPVGDVDSAVYDKSFLFTGTLESMKRKDAQARVEALGGRAPSSITAALDFLVIGDKDMEKFNEGWRSSKLKKAEKFIGQGAPMRIIAESEFVGMLGD